MTVHNVNIRKRDDNDNAVNRMTLRMQYRACEHLFVHTEQMKRDLVDDFSVSAAKVSIIPFSIQQHGP